MATEEVHIRGVLPDGRSEYPDHDCRAVVREIVSVGMGADSDRHIMCECDCVEASFRDYSDVGSDCERSRDDR